MTRVARSRSGETGSGPLYMQVVKDLSSGIRSGRYPTGSLLPPEIELSQHYGVSRQTVRAAMQRLREAGLISRRPGAGTRVTESRSSGTYVHSVSSLEEISQYTSETWMEVCGAHQVRVRGELARRLDSEEHTAWYHIAGLRRRGDDDLPLGWTDLYVRPAYADVRAHIGHKAEPVYKLIEALYGVSIVAVSQEIRATSVPQGLRELFGVEADTPALYVARKYYDQNHRLVEGAFSLHPYDRFSYSITLTRQGHDPSPT